MGNKYSAKRWTSSIATDARTWADSYLDSSNTATAHLSSLGAHFADSCFFCSARVPGEPKDHIFPVSKGGPTVPGNLIYSCSRCNFSRTEKSPLDFWRNMDPDLRFHKTVKDLLADLGLVTQAFKAQYPEEYRIAVEIQDGSPRAWLEFCKNVAEFTADAPQFDGVSNKSELMQSFIDFYNMAKLKQDTNLSAFERLEVRTDDFAKNAVIAANSSGGAYRSRSSFRSSIANAALRFEESVSMSGTESEQKRELGALLRGLGSKAAVTPYRKLLEFQGEGYKHLAELALETEREIGRQTGALKTQKRNSARALIQAIESGNMRSLSEKENDLLEFAILHPRAGRPKAFETFVASVHSGEVELPNDYRPSEKAQTVLDVGKP